MKKVEKLKAGMEVWMKFRVEDICDIEYPFRLSNNDFGGGFTEDCRYFKDEPPIEMFTIDENEIPDLKGVEMEVSTDGVKWIKRKVYGKTERGYLTSFGFYNEVLPIPISKTFDLTNVPEHLLTDELKQYLR